MDSYKRNRNSHRGWKGMPVKSGDVITVAAGGKYTVIAGAQGLQLIEIQLRNGPCMLE